MEFHVNKGTVYFFLKGRGDFSRPDFGRLKPPLPPEWDSEMNSEE
jgi:hypothetical protein